GESDTELGGRSRSGMIVRQRTAERKRPARRLSSRRGQLPGPAVLGRSGRAPRVERRQFTPHSATSSVQKKTGITTRASDQHLAVPVQRQPKPHRHPAEVGCKKNERPFRQRRG